MSDRVRRAGLPFGCLLGAPPCSRIVRWTWLGLIAVAAAAALFPGMVPSSHRGLTLRVGQPWRSTAATDAGRLVTRLTLGDRAPAWSPAPHVVLSGWIFAPVSGDYHFELEARGDALLEVDGAAVPGARRPRSGDLPGLGDGSVGRAPGRGQPRLGIPPDRPLLPAGRGAGGPEAPVDGARYHPATADSRPLSPAGRDAARDPAVARAGADVPPDRARGARGAHRRAALGPRRPGACSRLAIGVRHAVGRTRAHPR